MIVEKCKKSYKNLRMQDTLLGKLQAADEMYHLHGWSYKKLKEYVGFIDDPSFDLLVWYAEEPFGEDVPALLRRVKLSKKHGICIWVSKQYPYAERKRVVMGHISRLCLSPFLVNHYPKKVKK